MVYNRISLLDRGFKMFEQNMMENLQEMKEVAEKQLALVETVKRQEMTDNDFAMTKKGYNLVDQSENLELIIASIDTIFLTTKNLKKLEKKFSELL